MCRKKCTKLLVPDATLAYANRSCPLKVLCWHCSAVFVSRASVRQIHDTSVKLPFANQCAVSFTPMGCVSER